MKGDIRRLVSNGLYTQALILHAHLHNTNTLSHTHSFIYPPLFKACAKLKSSPLGQSLHAITIKSGLHQHLYTSTALTNMYLQLHRLRDARKLFDEMPERRNIVSVNATISGLSQNGYFREAFVEFGGLFLSGVRPNSVTIASLLSGCECLEDGMVIHGFGVKLGVEIDVYVGTALLTMYSNCGEVVSALRMFELIRDKNVVSYNALMTLLLQYGMAERVLELFKVMRKSLCERMSLVTWVSVLSACAVLVDVKFGMLVHGLILKYELEYDVKVGTTLVDMYSKCGCWTSVYGVFKEMEGCRNLFTWNCMISGMLLNGQCESAVYLFEQLESERLVADSATWNTMISGFSQLGKGVEAFYFFIRMQLAGVNPSLKSVTSLLPACSALSAYQSGKVIHGYAIRTSIHTDEFLVTSLLDMYMKCGFCSWARRVFDHFERRSDDPALWNAMISGYGRNGENENALRIFELMKEEGVQPNSATFSGILSASSHAGEVEKGLELFKMMTRHYQLSPTLEHFGCMVDLLGRAGRLEEAWALIDEFPDPLTSFYASLLGACRCHLEAELGEEITERLLELDPRDPSPLVILSSIYAAQGRWSDVERVRDKIRVRGLRKLPAYSSIGDTKRAICS